MQLIMIHRTMLYILILIVISCNNADIDNYPGHTLHNNTRPAVSKVTHKRIDRMITVFEEQFRCDIYKWRAGQIHEYVNNRVDRATNNELLVLIFEYNTEVENLWR